MKRSTFGLGLICIILQQRCNNHSLKLNVFLRKKNFKNSAEGNLSGPKMMKLRQVPCLASCRLRPEISTLQHISCFFNGF